jgi:hypothetical protein
VIREGVIDMLSSAIGGLLLISALREIVSKPNAGGLWAGLIPITQQKWPWALLILAMFALLWRALRRLGGPDGVLWGAAVWARRLTFWWGLTALLLFLSATLAGLLKQPLARLNWGFAVGYLLATLCVVAGSEWFRRRVLETHVHTQQLSH